MLIFCIQSEASKDKQLKRQNSNVSKSDIAIDVNENPAEDSPPESERKEAVKVEEPEVTQKKGSFTRKAIISGSYTGFRQPRTG